MDDLEKTKNVLLKVLQMRIPEAKPEYDELPKADGSKELVMILHLKKMPCVGFTISMDSILREYQQSEILLGEIIQLIVSTYQKEEDVIYKGILRAMLLEEKKGEHNENSNQ